MNTIWILLIGFIAGMLAKLMMPGRDPGGFIVTGIAGSVLAGTLGRTAGLYAEGAAAGFVMSMVGALLLLILLVIYKLVVRSRSLG